PLACLCRSKKSISEILAWIESNSKGRRFVQIFSGRKAVVDSLLPAYLNAMERERWGMLRSKDPMHEMLALVAKTFDIRKAISRFGADTNTRFIVFATDSSIFSRFSRANGIKIITRYKLRLSVGAASEINSFLLMQK
ncbi:MAG: hypothetical protein QW144_01880, partial [Candidatus Micrarchaeaceae archaeon]